MFATIVLAAALLAQTPTIEIKEDPVDHEKTTTLNLGTIAKLHDGHLDLAIHFHGDSGPRGPVAPEKKLSLHFSAESKSWNFLRFRKVVMADGSGTVDFGEPKHRGDVGRGGVLEQFFAYSRFDVLERLANQPRLRGKAGAEVFELNDVQQAALRKYVQRLKVSEDEAAKMADADRQADAEKQQAKDARRQTLLAEWDQVKKKAESDARKGSKSAYQKNLARNLERAEEAFRNKHELTVPECRELLGWN